MTMRRPQVLVVTNSASLVIGLTFATHDWEITSQLPCEPVPADVDVVVLDLHDQVRSLEQARRMPAPAIVVLGTDPGSCELPAHVTVLVRPFTSTTCSSGSIRCWARRPP